MQNVYHIAVFIVRLFKRFNHLTSVHKNEFEQHGIATYQNDLLRTFCNLSDNV